MAADWTAARAAMMLDPSVTNLNSGSWGPLSRPVFERATDLRSQLAAGPMDFFVRRLPPLLWDARERLAGFLCCDARRLMFTSNVSASINLVASSLQIAGPGEVLLTDHEYGAMHWCWERAARRLGFTLRTFPLPMMAEEPGPIIEAAIRAMTPRTRVLFFSHVLSPTGLVLPARELCQEARRRGVLTVVDGAHAAGLVPLDLPAIPADFYAGNAHKWLLAPSGTGFLHLGPGTEDRLAPFHISWGWHTTATDLDAPDEFGSTARLRRLEFEGTRDVVPWLCVPEAIDFQAALGFDAVRARQRELAARAKHKCAFLRQATPGSPEMSGPMSAFEAPPGTDPVRLRKALWAERVEVNVIERPDRLLVRLSTNFYNTADEVARLAALLPGMLAASRRA
jgi:isopenicillin-N epimerase